MEAGRLNRRVRIERRARCATDEAMEWRLVTTTWAHVRMLNGKQALVADAPVSCVRASVRIRYIKGLCAGMRVTVDDFIMRIEAVLPDMMRRDHIDLVCVSDEC